jgi:hypothetical protein
MGVLNLILTKAQILELAGGATEITLAQFNTMVSDARALPGVDASGGKIGIASELKGVFQTLVRACG